MNANGRSGEANLIGARDLEHQLAEAQRIAHVGSWQWDVTTDRRWWSEEIYRIAGVGDQGTGPTNVQFLALVHHDDRAMVQEAVRAAVEDGAGYDVEHRIVRTDGEERIVRSLGEVSRD